MKNEKGLTLLGTIVLVVLIGLIVFAIVYFTRMGANKEKEEHIKTDLLLVEAKITNISGKNILEKKDEVLVGTKLSEMKEEPEIKEFLDKKLFDPEEKNTKYYVLNQEDLNDLELGKVILEEGSYYIVEYNSSRVYYTKGYMDENGDMHYKVEKQAVENSEEKNQEGTNQEKASQKETNQENSKKEE